MKIKSIKIDAFRGIPQNLELDLQGKSLLLLGENGTGKSSIIDAIEFFFTGKISHLKSKGTLSLNEYGPNTKNPDKASVGIEFKSGAHFTSRTFSSNPSFPKNFNENIELAKNGKFILRRSQILNLINTTPAQRYAFISEIIGANELEKTSTAMDQAKKYLDDEVRKIENNIKKNNDDIKNILQVQDSNNILPTINDWLGKEYLNNINSLEKLEDCINHLKTITKSSDKELIGALDNISVTINEILLIVKDVTQEFYDAETYKERINQSHAQSDLSLIKLLKNSLEIINKDTANCPLCENKVNSNELLEKVNKRLESLESLQEINDNMNNSLKRIKGNIQLINRDLANLLSKIDYFDELKEFKDELEQQIISLNVFQERINANSFLREDVSGHDFELLHIQLEKNLNNIIIGSDGLSDSIKPSERDKRLNVLIKLFSDLDENLKKQEENRRELKVAKNHAKISEIMYEEFSAIKKRKIQEVYDTVKENVERYYAILHPDEPYENFNLDVDLNPKKKGSTDLRMTIFGEENQDPRAISSEGHLDSLGLCIFLALFEKSHGDFPLLVLDDVVTTMDSRHRENVCQLLFQEFSDRQFIITTHDAIWYDQLKAAQRVHNLGNNFKNCNIIKWDNENGPEIRPYKVRWDKITEIIANGDKQCAGNEGRRYLEWLLMDLCNRTQAKIPAKYYGKYEVNDLLKPAKSRLLELIKDEEYNQKLESSFDKLDQTIMMGNLLSHENLMAGNVSIDEVERFCRSINHIHELTLCSNCKAPLGYYQNLKILRCSNKKCSDPLEIKAK
ncbi:hypothetical protein BK009_03395 [Methanobacterium subterraneum]|uniref:RecF/RecN/SMC N-terminal domain-containing protein n=1 Tax=Methanobacterium subterraneum TaxID=59277 RepID=A0A2H4VNX2_9EURY|nr:ATP-binding protein [Methanobacterium subterraneum]AUB59804.1 hypothetical protein BK009_03395 [Methanobacterium subterraneum]